MYILDSIKPEITSTFFRHRWLTLTYDNLTIPPNNARRQLKNRKYKKNSREIRSSQFIEVGKQRLRRSKKLNKKNGSVKNHIRQINTEQVQNIKTKYNRNNNN